MKRKLLRRSKLKWIIPVVAMLMVSPAIYGAPSDKASKTAQNAELTSKYALTQQQLQQYDQLAEERNAAITAVNANRNLSRPERGKRVRAAVEDFENKMSSVMNKEQYDKWLKDRKTVRAQNAKNTKELKSEIDKIRKSNIPHLQQEEQIAAAETQYMRNAAMVSGNQENAEHKLAVRHSRNTMSVQGKNNVKMSFEQAQQLKTLTDDKNNEIAKLKAQNLPIRQYNTERSKLITEYYASVQKLLANQKYAQWDKNRNTWPERNLQKRYDMTPEQIAKYKELQNAQAIERYKVFHGKLPKSEREAKLKEIDSKYDSKIKEILTANQSGKLFADKAYRKQKQATKNKK